MTKITEINHSIVDEIRTIKSYCDKIIVDCEELAFKIACQREQAWTKKVSELQEMQNQILKIKYDLSQMEFQK